MLNSPKVNGLDIELVNVNFQKSCLKSNTYNDILNKKGQNVKDNLNSLKTKTSQKTNLYFKCNYCLSDQLSRLVPESRPITGNKQKIL